MVSGLHGNADRDNRFTSRRRPPDYRSRSLQLQLFVLVAALMTVLVAMNESRKPATWAWLWAEGKAARHRQGNDVRVAELSSDEAANAVGGSADVDRLVPAGQLATRAEPDPGGDSQWAWRQIYGTLHHEDRRQLGRLLRAARLDRGAADEDAAIWTRLIERLDQRWSRWLVELRHIDSSSGSAPMDGRTQRIEQQVAMLEEVWRQQDRPALAGVARNSTSESDRRVLDGLQATFDERDLAEVRDDTVWRPAEREAWFRMLERLQRTDPRQLARESVGEVDFIQIFRQSAEYRGKVITVRGTARLGYRVAAPVNDLGVKGYYLFWLRLADGTNDPVVVYALEPPEGFPALSELDQTPLDEEFVVSGFYFKRWLYRSHAGANSVPAIITRMPEWLPRSAPQASAVERMALSMGSWARGAAVLFVGLLAAVSLMLAWLAIRPGRTRVAARMLRDNEPATDWARLPAADSVQESLRRLEQDGPPGR